MKGFIQRNQSLAIVLGVVLFLIVLYFIFKALPTKVAKKSKKEDEKQEAKQVEDKEENSQVEESVSSEDQQGKEIEKKAKKEDKKPKIVQVFKRTERPESEDGKKSRALDPIYDRNIEFINTSKNIAKFKSFVEDVPEELEDPKTDEFGFVTDHEKDCVLCDDNVKHFDHTRRISRAIKDGSFDEMFGSHISEKYLNINSEKHLKLDDNFSDKLFSRAENTMKNGYSKLNIQEQPENVKFSLFADYHGGQIEDGDELVENVSVDMKTALIAETYFGKRKKIEKK